MFGLVGREVVVVFMWQRHVVFLAVVLAEELDLFGELAARVPCYVHVSVGRPVLVVLLSVFEIEGLDEGFGGVVGLRAGGGVAGLGEEADSFFLGKVRGDRRGREGRGRRLTDVKTPGSVGAGSGRTPRRSRSPHAPPNAPSAISRAACGFM